MESQIVEAYQKYLQVFPNYWNLEIAIPIPISEFHFFYQIAQDVTKIYERDLCQGVLSSVTYYLKMNFDQFLGIPHTESELAHAFKHGFVSES